MMSEGCMALPDRVAMPAEGTAVAETGNIEQTTNATDRMIMYDATLHLVVPRLQATLDTIKGMATTFNGYMQSLSSSSIILRIPQPRLNEVMLAIEKLGEVTSREIKGTDVTEEMMDLDIRLKNLQETHDKLTKLLERAEKVEDVLAVEKELERVTGSLELLKGRIKYLSHAVQYSTLTVYVNSPVPQQELRDVIPFAWIQSLASDILPDPDMNYRPDRRFRSWLRMELPADCVKVYDYKGCTRAMSGNGVLLLIRQQGNFEGGTLDFWAPLIRRGLSGEKAISLGATGKLTLDTGATAIKFAGTKEIGRKTYQYLLWVVATGRDIYTYECWGLADDVNRMQAELEKSAKSMRIKP